jgi:UDP:flavonoid glycosyltransferase YjiC (YdhE family)
VLPGRLDEDELRSLGVAVDLADLRVEPPDRPGPTPEAIRTCQEQLAEDEADLYLIDIEAHEYVFAALGAGLPVGLLNVLFNLWKRPGVPPIHQDVVPGRGLRGSRVGIEYGWAGFRAKGLPSTVRSKVKRDDRRHHLLAMARDLGLRPRGLVTEFQNLIPFQYRTLPALCVSLPELELPGAVHPLNHYVGPMPNVAGVGMEPAEADAVVEEIDTFRREHSGRRLVYGAFGAFYGGDDLAFWRRAVAAVGERDDWIGIFGLGGRIDPADLAPLPENVRVFSWAPQMRVLEWADCAVVHAGMTSVYECLHHRVPMVVFPIGESFDQFGTAARVAYHGLAPVGDRNTATAADIRALIDEALSDPVYGSQVRAFGDAMDRHAENRALTTAIEAMAAEVGVAAPSA